MAKKKTNKKKQNNQKNNSRRNNSRNNKKRNNTREAKRREPKEKILTYKPGMTVRDAAEQMNKPVSEIIKKLMFMKIMASQTQVIDRDTAELLAMEYGYEIKDKEMKDVTRFEEMKIEDSPEDLVARPPVVTVMGHVDHGKTTLLDNIRKTRVVQSEAGGITQHIGAYQVMRNDKAITFIDTPGHAAFTEMRARGAKITDIIILVVAADDGVMPQTKEAIDHAKASECSIIVAVNKIDLPGADPERVKKELADLNVMPDDWGGEIPFVNMSALTGEGVDELLETIQLVADMLELKANPDRKAVGTVIEAKLDKGRGPVATILVNNGTMQVGDVFVVGSTYGKVRAMTNDIGKEIASAKPGMAVEIIGLDDVPNAGDPFRVFEDEKATREIASKRADREFDKEHNARQALSLKEFFEKADGNMKELRLIIKADTQGSIEAFKGSINKIEIEGTSIDIVRTGVGPISDTDLTLAEASDAIIIGFDVGAATGVRDNAKSKGVEIRDYRVIYEALDDIEKAMKGLLDPVYERKVIGEATVRNTFSISKVGTVAGCMVTSGVVRRDALAKLIRNGKVVHEGKLSSLKRFKDDVKEVKQGYECGLMFENYNDIKVDDQVEVAIMEEVEPDV